MNENRYDKQLWRRVRPKPIINNTLFLETAVTTRQVGRKYIADYILYNVPMAVN